MSGTVLAANRFGLGARPGDAGASAGDDPAGWLMLLAGGGTVKGGRVLADWPGLQPAQLWQGRDLRPTVDVRGVLAGALAGHFGLDSDQAARAMFGPGVRPATGLVRV